MFTVEIVSGIGQPVTVVKASQVVIRGENGTPISVAALFGGSNGVMVSHCGDAEFQRNLSKLCIKDTVITERIEL
jgi:hypothetical protein